MKKKIIKKSTKATSKTTAKPKATTKSQFSKKSSKLNTEQLKYCRCALHLMEGNSNIDKSLGRKPHTCNRKRLFRQVKKCYNPYAVCAKVKKTTTGRRPCDYDFQKIPKSKVISYLMFNEKKYNEWAKSQNKIHKTKIPLAATLSRKSESTLRRYINKWYKRNK